MIPFSPRLSASSWWSKRISPRKREFSSRKIASSRSCCVSGDDNPAMIRRFKCLITFWIICCFYHFSNIDSNIKKYPLHHLLIIFSSVCLLHKLQIDVTFSITLSINFENAIRNIHRAQKISSSVPFCNFHAKIIFCRVVTNKEI